jgi:polyisoprenoid-binding protein YceI
MITERLRIAILMLGAVSASAQPRAIDTKASSITVRVFKAGLLSAFGHDHDMEAPIAAGSVDVEARQVELRVNAATLRVRDPKASESDRAEIQKTMLGPQVLDTQQYPEIIFRSTSADRGEQGGWAVHGSLTLHGQTRPVTVTVKEENGHYAGFAVLKQSDFGIRPIKVAGGSVRVKDELRIEFDLQMAH